MGPSRELAVKVNNKFRQAEASSAGPTGTALTPLSANVFPDWLRKKGPLGHHLTSILHFLEGVQLMDHFSKGSMKVCSHHVRSAPRGSWRRVLSKSNDKDILLSWLAPSCSSILSSDKETSASRNQ